MNNELICTPVMLPTKDETSSLLLVAGEPKLRVNKHGTYASGEGWDYQHLYLVSEQEIKIGDWGVNIFDKRIDKCTASNRASIEEHWRKIISTTDESLSLPLIPSSFIERWVNEQGKIDEVRVKMTNKPTMMSTTLGKFVPMENANEEVIILPIEDKTYSREEINAILKSFAEYMESGKVASFKGFYTDKPLEQQDWHPIGDIINEWFDKHY